MNGQLELRIITQPYSAVYCGYFRRLVLGNSLTKHIKLSSFSYSAVILSLPISHIPPCFHANPPDFPRLIGPREYAQLRSVLEMSQNANAPEWLKGSSRNHEQSHDIVLTKFQLKAALILLLPDNNS